VLVLARLEPVELSGQSDIHLEPDQRFIGAFESFPAGRAFAQVGFLEPFAQIEGRIQKAAGKVVPVRAREVVRGGQQPRQQIERAREDDHLGWVHER